MTDSQSSAVVPSGVGSASFAQQGSLDWVALGNMQYTTSIAILGRLAKAGIDPLTVAFGQAMCTRLPIGVHGERVLAEAMSTLTAKSCAADLLWFGTGIRHVLRELVQTSQGCSLVALCAGLTESHNIPVCALVLYDIAKELGGPQEIQPSFEQWEALVRTTASVFNATTFGLRVHQIAKFAPPAQVHTASYHPVSRPARLINTRPDVPRPTDLAKVLLSIGQIVLGNLQAVSVQGGCSCSWIAAWGDFVLGLRVLVRDTDGNIVFANFNAMAASAQISVAFVEDTPENNIIQVQTSHSIRSGVDFVRNCFGKQGNYEVGNQVFQSGKLNWETMWHASFGQSFAPLVQPDGGDKPETPPNGAFGLLSEKEGPLQIRLMTNHTIFTRLVAIAIIILFTKSPTLSHYGTIQSYFICVCNYIPELRSCKEKIWYAIEARLTLFGADDVLLDRSTSATSSPVDNLILEYTEHQVVLGDICRCKYHSRSYKGRLDQFCLCRLTDTMIYVMFMLDRVVLDSPLKPTIYGMHQIYEASIYITKETDRSNTRSPKRFQNSLGKPHGYYQGKLVQILTRSIDDWSGDLFVDLAALFAGQAWKVDLHGSVARSDGKLYCYSQLIEEPTDNIQDASKVHVGSGQMTYRSRIQRAIYDTSGHREHEPGYPASQTESVNSVDCLTHDTTSTPITPEIIIVETPTFLYFRHQITTNLGQFWIAPTLLLQQLRAAVAYQTSERIPLSDKLRWEAVLQGHTYIKTQGEGLVHAPEECHMLRPLHGNILGRCVAVAKTNAPVALVKSRRDLALFARYWCRDYDSRQEAGAAFRYFVLVS